MSGEKAKVEKWLQGITIFIISLDIQWTCTIKINIELGGEKGRK